MPKKLVLDRTVEKNLYNSESLLVPADEVWRVSVLGEATINGTQLKTKSSNGPGEVISNALLASGSRIGGAKDSSCMISGLAFKLQEV